MFTPRMSPLTEAISIISQRHGGGFSALNHPDPEYAEYVGAALCLGISPIRELLPPGRYAIAGGIIRSLFNNELPKDVDIFVLGSSDTIQEGMSKLEANLGGQIKKVKVTHEGFDKHIQLLDSTDMTNQYGYSLQFIGQYYNEQSTGREISMRYVEDVVSYFDILPICFGIEFQVAEMDPATLLFSNNITIDKVVRHPLLMKCLANKELRVNPYGPFGIKKMRADRFYKYIHEYGFHIPSDEEMKKFNSLLSQSDLNVEADYF